MPDSTSCPDRRCETFQQIFILMPRRAPQRRRPPIDVMVFSQLLPAVDDMTIVLRRLVSRLEL
jgi:hypothetical protein